MSSTTANTEYDPLLPNPRRMNGREAAVEEQPYPEQKAITVRGTTWGVLTLLFVSALVFLLFFQDSFRDWVWSDRMPKDPRLAALKILDEAPIIVRASS